MTQATYERKGLLQFTVLGSILVRESQWYEPEMAGHAVSAGSQSVTFLTSPVEDPAHEMVPFTGKEGLSISI